MARLREFGSRLRMREPVANGGQPRGAAHVERQIADPVSERQEGFEFPALDSEALDIGAIGPLRMRERPCSQISRSWSSDEARGASARGSKEMETAISALIGQILTRKKDNIPYRSFDEVAYCAGAH